MSLKEFLASEAEKLRSEQAEALTKRQEWIASVDRLIAQIKDWLAQADNTRILRIEEAPLRLSEQGLGSYEISSLTIGLGPREVRVKPVARYVATPMRSNGVIRVPRAYGRVDMTNGLDRYMLFRTAIDPDDLWIVVEQDEPTMARLDQDSFESAFERLLE